MVEWILWIGMAALAAGFNALAFIGWFRGRPRREIPKATKSVDFPGVCVIIPMSGSARSLEAFLETVLSQDYPDYEVLLVTRTPDEAAALAARSFLAGRPAGSFPACAHIVCGPASTCGQKNHALLAGIGAAAEDREIYVFLDAGRPTPSFWLKALVEPIARGEVPVTTGYHHVLPEGSEIVATGHAVVTLFLNCIQETGWFTQPWGGNTAVSRNAFEQFGVREIWAHNVVDDVSLGTVLLQKKKKVKFVRDAQLLTPLTGESFTDWRRWLTRQILYLKFCQPGSWILAIFLVTLCALLVPVAVLRITASLAGIFPAGTILPDLLFPALLAAASWTMRASHPRPGPPLKWLAASFATLFTAAFCTTATLFTGEILWRGIRYRVSTGGRVKGITDETH